MRIVVLALSVCLAFGAGSALGFTLAPQASEALNVLSLDAARVLASANSGAVSIGSLSFDLQPRPIAEGAVWGLDGLPQGIVTETVTFKGTANGFPARLAATKLGVFAAVFGPDPVFVEPLWVVQPGAPVDQHVMVRWSEALPVIPAHEEPPMSQPDVDPPLLTEPEPRTVRFLVESDFKLYMTSSVQGACQACWVQVQQAALNIAEQLFEPQTLVSFQVTSQWACTTATSCPYAGNMPGAHLNAFRDRWEGIQGEPPHELGHLFVGVDLADVAGVSYGGVRVGTTFGYQVSELLAEGTSLGNFGNLQYALAAHEIGHSFGAVHAEADPIPPTLVPTGLAGPVWTIMDGNGNIVRYEFSAGTWNPAHNNLARIVAASLQQLSP